MTSIINLFPKRVTKEITGAKFEGKPIDKLWDWHKVTGLASGCLQRNGFGMFHVENNYMPAETYERYLSRAQRVIAAINTDN